MRLKLQALSLLRRKLSRFAVTRERRNILIGCAVIVGLYLVLFHPSWPRPGEHWREFEQAKKLSRPFKDTREFLDFFRKDDHYVDLVKVENSMSGILGTNFTYLGKCHLGGDNIKGDKIAIPSLESGESCRDNPEGPFSKTTSFYWLFEHYQWRDSDGNWHVFGVKR